MKNLRIISYKDVAIHCDVSDDKAQKIISEMRKTYDRKKLTTLHLFDYLGISELSVISELVNPMIDTLESC